MNGKWEKIQCHSLQRNNKYHSIPSFFKKLFSCVKIASCSIILNRQELTANSIQIKEITVCIFSQGERRREIEIVYFPTQFQPAEKIKQI